MCTIAPRPKFGLYIAIDTCVETSRLRCIDSLSYPDQILGPFQSLLHIRCRVLYYISHANIQSFLLPTTTRCLSIASPTDPKITPNPEPAEDTAVMRFSFP